MLVIGLGLMLASPAGAQVYRWTDEHGGVHLSDMPKHAGYALYRPVSTRPLPRAPRRKRPVATSAWDRVIRKTGKAHGVHPALVKAVIHVESAFEPEAVSRAGAQGMMQLMPGTARTLGVNDPFNPWENIDGGTRYLRKMLRRFEGDPELALAAYNAGPSAVDRYEGIPPYRETRRYVKDVLKHYARYRLDFAGGWSGE